MDSPVALVTGGGSGIGLAVAEHLIQFHGYKVAILDLVEERVKEAAIKLGDNCLALCVDITDYQAQAKAFLQTWEWGGCRLDFVFLNAGIGDSDSLYLDSSIDPQTDLPLPLNLRVFDVNLNAVLQGIHLARHFFSDKNSIKGGRIVVTASMLGLYPNHSIPMYSSTKHALVGLVRSLAPVYAKDAITVNALCPALIETNIMAEHVRPMWDRKQLTPLNTALKAMDMVVADKKLTGKTMELSLENVDLKTQPEYSTENIRWVCEQHTLWETVAEPVLPRKPGQNTDLTDAP
ncbi:Putative short-chain dehydrogenase/reductase SDR, NAD(P)-binding domain superfamily [Septoria linicola]|uniref:Short-chain dehydrogenase/reductase SDR, NAD(P)-binding domain superfamily n=1 Tax=Septoria linicola TaxID=215465 RepID=A0A9Q9EHM5_9PEZI|nr:putative short-chain dehydrogenase/reductase SDR, NAD(P)-binding domain superfamily [Septoria linicola]USW50174.1 Putative short-chain dehydrogenase/reductase SDR, NAD(P)-binding domain superfamily [Septoria linicola]